MDEHKELDDLARPLAARVKRAGLRSLSEPERVAYLVWAFAHELDNGGPDTFFYNDSGRFAEQTVDALHSIAARALAEALEDAARDLEDQLDALREAYEERGPDRVRKATLRFYQAQTGATPTEE